MMNFEEKTAYQWEEEAETFVAEWRAATNTEPTLDDVIAECKDIGIENYEEYAAKLFSYMN